jgi:hypothetical protein
VRERGRERESEVERERERGRRWSAHLATLELNQRQVDVEREIERERQREVEREREREREREDAEDVGWRSALEEAAAALERERETEAELREVERAVREREREREAAAAASAAALASANTRLVLEWEEEEEAASEREAEREAARLASPLALSLLLNEAWHSSHRGPLVTINGLRLGRLPNLGSNSLSHSLSLSFSLSHSASLPWPETNAALGYLTALLVSLTSSLSHGPLSGGRRLRFAGSASSLILSRSVLPLHGSPSLSLSKLLWSRRFDAALRQLAAVVAELGSTVSAADPSFRLPYPFSPSPSPSLSPSLSSSPSLSDSPPSHVGGCSLSLSLSKSSGIEWSRACKCLVVNVKWMLIWVAANGG